MIKKCFDRKLTHFLEEKTSKSLSSISDGKKQIENFNLKVTTPHLARENKGRHLGFPRVVNYVLSTSF